MAVQLKTRYVVIKLILDNSNFPSSASNPNASNIKIIRSDSSNTTTAIDATINKSIGFLGNTADVNIFGLLNADIDAFSRFQRQKLDPFAQNFIEIYAGYVLDSTNMPPFLYKGEIVYTGADYNNINRALHIMSISGLYSQNLDQAPLNLKGTVSIDNVFRNIIYQSLQAEYTYVPIGPINGSITNPRFTGSLTDQLDQVCEHYEFYYNIDGGQIIVSATSGVLNNNITVINAQNGMLGYPVINDTGIDVRVRFNPDIQFGQYINVQSKVNLANDNWYINSIIHNLQTKSANWHSILKLNVYATQGPQNNG